MFDRDEFLRNHGLVEVASPANESRSDAADYSDPNVLEAPPMTDSAQRSHKDIVAIAAMAFANARRRLRGQPEISIDSARSVASDPHSRPDTGPTGNVEIINTVPQAMVDERTDYGSQSGPGPKGIVVDKDRGIIGMQG